MHIRVFAGVDHNIVLTRFVSKALKGDTEGNRTAVSLLFDINIVRSGCLSAVNRTQFQITFAETQASGAARPSILLDRLDDGRRQAG